MICEGCHKEIPADDQREVTVNGETKLIYPFCDKCQAEIDRKMEQYDFEARQRSKDKRGRVE